MDQHGNQRWLSIGEKPAAGSLRFRLSGDFRWSDVAGALLQHTAGLGKRYSLTWELFRCDALDGIDFHGTFVEEGDVAERQATVKLLPVPQPSLGTLRRACKRPRCGNEIDPPEGRSRPRDFCSDSCRTLYQRERDQARNNLLEARRLAVQYEIDDSAAAEGSTRQGRPPAELPADPGSLPSATASHLALALIAQALESIRVDMQDGEPVGLEEVLARITQAKEEGDRLLRTRRPREPGASS
jgi:hypothetical protein